MWILLASVGGAATLGAGLSRCNADAAQQSGDKPAFSDVVLSTKSDSATTTFGDMLISRSTPIELYQYENCPWCNKVKASLDYYKVPYRAIEVHPIFKQEMPSKEYRKVPVVVTPAGTIVTESDNIVNCIVQYSAVSTPKKSRGWFFGKRSSAAAAPEQRSVDVEPTDEEVRWLEWANTKLVTCLTATIYSNFQESFETMEYIRYVPSFSVISQEAGYYLGSIIMRWVGTRLPSKYGLDSSRLYEELTDRLHSFIDAVGDRPFLGGAAPNRADLAVFGFLRAVHTSGTFRKLVSDEKITPWWTRMVEAVGESARVETILPEEMEPFRKVQAAAPA